VHNGEVSLNLARLGRLGLLEVGRFAQMLSLQLLSEGLISSLGEHRLFLKDGENTQGLLWTFLTISRRSCVAQDSIRELGLMLIHESMAVLTKNYVASDTINGKKGCKILYFKGSSYYLFFILTLPSWQK
jgi:hypothetical protein